MTEAQKVKQAEIAEFKQHKDDIRDAAEKAKEVIAKAAELAADTIARAAAVSVQVVDTKSASDHDLLITLKTLMEVLDRNVSNLTANVTSGMTAIEHTKANQKDLDALKVEITSDIEPRLRKQEEKGSTYWTSIGLLMAAIGVMATVIIMHIVK